MKVEILCVGTELLLGDILNTNAQFLAKEFGAMGFSMYHQAVVGDNVERLKREFELAINRADIVVTTGGLGPTDDDLTKETAAEYFNKKLIFHKESYDEIVKFFNKIGKEISENNKKQAYFPEGCTILKNDHGTAPGCIIDENDKVVILLPGPPREIIPMFRNYVIPYLRKYQEGTIVSKVLRVCGIGESGAAEMLKDLIDNQTNPTIAPYAKDNEVTFRITAKAESEEVAMKLIEPMERKVRERLKENVYGVGDTSLEDVLGAMLIEKKLTIATAESCTGGLLSGRLINYPGISEVFMEGAVTYSNEAKMNRLGVKKETLESYGAVSSETAAEMAKGIAKTAGTNIGVSTTGVAGPGGGTKEKPVGLVYVGLCINGKVKTRKLNMPGDRQTVRNRVVNAVIDWIRREIINL
ncbi:nicotinamide-nucleotide amidase [Clostridium acetobutylicum]|uniref:Putative competence-damage inducible protein n=1 Tax=Clostridium acetobutylicum (strain ATCC 824 / DSM 792 / JCM 1419 / IAM 19013 / LMG 5710 / NBRC 13948 / NRRL B-527 / VKM B-1787 / 2291 / W) TaxID=272562 RepID=CINA_CLOAB|nr:MULTISPECIES: competence/damage-inducible protein A [Clostridium]Q97D94.1 RecName: Full=Putative competence-damage inducible protein [Clostridium acetobutylicum ATCC 824]AAK81509.1 Competence-damage inducible protein, CINA [Clostridium acetobutylicum ATCC 824]ADZ22630.1 competence damage-inducible protein A [Clostridium acetobutylicum EA 2018]AEI34149.1 competence damage-inducible protein A [Clostridium acetobutylicum DSM 1731]AWV80817.1 competence/damage-inducible protein A [Clostridium ac